MYECGFTAAVYVRGAETQHNDPGSARNQCIVPLSFCLLRKGSQYVQLATLVVLCIFGSVGPVMVGCQNELELQEKLLGKVG
jgi:hypothetical protein